MKFYINYRNYNGLWMGDKKLEDVVIYDKDGSEFTMYLTSEYASGIAFDLPVEEIKRKVKKDFKKRVPFFFRNGTDWDDKAKYDLYIPAEMVDFGFAGERETDDSDDYHRYHKDFTFIGFRYNKDEHDYEATKFVITLTCSKKTEKRIQIEELLDGLKKCSYGLNLSYYELENILEKYDITPKPISTVLE